eukprot:GHVN01011943.1.p1 GENE.GHVN01011943.1~~GHVN01011943.1.p1  ORF type:complete len:554 (-),score=135.64 GHVN01011943.1:212-1873(-)
MPSLQAKPPTLLTHPNHFICFVRFTCLGSLIPPFALNLLLLSVLTNLSSHANEVIDVNGLAPSPHHNDHVTLTHPRFSLSRVEELKQDGRRQYERITAMAGDSPPHSSQSPSSCNSLVTSHLPTGCISPHSSSTPHSSHSSDTQKSVVALILTSCHYQRAKRPVPKQCDLGHHLHLLVSSEEAPNQHSLGLSADTSDTTVSHAATGTGTSVSDSSEGEHVADVFKRTQWVDMCLPHLSESAFEVYIQFFNHLDSICFYLTSSAWQSSTEATVNRLALTSTSLATQLEQAGERQQKMLDSQSKANQLQTEMIEKSITLREAISNGKIELSELMGVMRDEVVEEQRKIKESFDGVFKVFYKVLDIHRYISARIADFSTSLLYTTLVVLTYYLTTTGSTIGSRLGLYAIWTIMAMGEAAINKLTLTSLYSLTSLTSLTANGKVTDQDILSDKIDEIVDLWRYTFLSMGFVMYFSNWYRYKDPKCEMIRALSENVIRVQDGLAALRNDVIREIRNEELTRYQTTSKRWAIDTLYLNRYQISDQNNSTDELCWSDSEK